MEATALLQEALGYERKIRDLYREAAATVDDPRGKAIFTALADDEQGHVDFLNYSLAQLEEDGILDQTRLSTRLPDPQLFASRIESMRTTIPERMLGDIKTVLNSALHMEKETSAFYARAAEGATGEIQAILQKFLEIEERHTELVRLELDHASGYGMWFDFMEVNLETE